jgi:micrococcal nuclease
MRTLTRFVAAVVTAAVVPACSVIARSAAHADPVATTATVLKVVDGDTVEIADDVRGRLRIRIDTPETKKPGYSIGCWGPQATEFAKSTLFGQRVAFVTDPSQGMYDRNGSNRQYLWIKIFYAASSVAVVSSGRSTSLPFSNFAPARTSATRWGALTARQRDWAASISL